MNTPATKKWHEWTLIFFKSVGVPALISIIATAYVGGRIADNFTRKLENDKAQIALLVQTKEKFDDSHNALIARVGVFANQVWGHQKITSREEILNTIITAQAQLIELKRQLGNENNPRISAYGGDLVKLQQQLYAVNKPEDLRPIYLSVERLLAEHDRIADEISNDTKLRSAT